MTLAATVQRLATGIAVCLAAATATAHAQTLKLIPNGSFPAGVTVSVLDTPQDNTPRRIAADADGSWVVTIEADPTAWRHEPTILIAFPGRTREADGVSSDAVTLQLDFNFKATESESQIDVPVEAFTSFGSRELTRVESLPRFQRYEQIFLAQGLALHFLSRLDNPEDALTRRMVQLWFDAIYNATAGEDESRPVRLGSEMQRVIEEVFPDRPDYFAVLTAQLRQRFWRDQADFEDLLAAHQCALAMNLANDLKRRHTAHPEDAGANAGRVGEPDQVIADLVRRAAACT